VSSFFAPQLIGMQCQDLIVHEPRPTCPWDSLPVTLMWWAEQRVKAWPECTMVSGWVFGSLKFLQGMQARTHPAGFGGNGR
jgi:hypothetical protein